ncbi:helix-turn-helix transcriptional regulator [Olivibacter sp. SDN3]|uniref:helix-turn-helix transcriptional regulator n=1 Tax=Olivibacter sp. SDN3 TaxID=2764720 RepID=UPI001651A067|nr:helix-turn-helix transcriptional regulator [Olivibacter sp. SDN3]QNL49170.1 helix-turn-helix transcriptional regulator [Olivibacter sp. SDN3]
MTKKIGLAMFQEIFRAEAITNMSDAYITDEVYTINHLHLSAKHRIIKFEGISIIYRDWQLPAPISLLTKHERPFLKMQFEIEGYSDFVSDVSIPYKSIEIPNGRHTLLFLPEVTGTLYYPNSRKVLDVIFTKEYISDLFGNDLRCLLHFGKSIENGQPSLIGNNSLFITNQMKRIIAEILHCTYHGIFKKTYIEAKIVELLNLQIDQFTNTNISATNTIKLHKEDIDKLYYLKEIIDKKPGANYSLMQLAEIGGFNDFKLKKGFKQLFGNTVFGYINDVRMEKSHELLREGKMSIANIAFLMGYKYPHHFSKTFKKKFGYLPKEVKA